MPVDSPPTLLLRTLGDLWLGDGSGRELLPGRRKELVLLAYLARRCPRTLARAGLAALLWGERREANARASLRQALLRLKRALGDAIRSDNETVSLQPGAIGLDIAMFEAAIGADRFADAVALWHGDFLATADDAGDERYRLWLDEERERSRQHLAWAYEQLVLASSRRAAHEDAVAWARQWSEALPLDEKAQLNLFKALRIVGRIGEARGQHAAFVARYREVFERDPAADLLRLAIDEDAPRAAAPREPTAAALAGVAVTHERLASETLVRGKLLIGASVLPLVGRGDEFSTLAEAWDDVRAGSGTVVLVEGAEGIGKTRLCAELLRWLAAQDTEMLVLRAAPAAEGDVQPWETLRTLVASLEDAPGLLGLAPSTLADLSRLLPSLRDRIRRLPDPSTDDFALRDAVIQALAIVSGELPVAVVLDDADRADAATWRALQALAPRVALMRVLLVLTATTEGTRRDPRLTILTTHSARVRQLSLGGLEVDDVERLVASAASLPTSDARALARRLHAEAEGNPRFVLDTVAEIAAAGHLARDAEGAWKLSRGLDARPLPVPASLRAAMTRRLAGVSEGARAMAELLAVASSPADAWRAARARGLSIPSLYAALDELVANRLLNASPDADIDRPAASAASPGREVLRANFVSPATRQAIAQSIPGDRRTELRRALGTRHPDATDGGSATARSGWRGGRLRHLAWAAALVVAAAGGLVAATARYSGARGGRQSGQVIAVGMIRGLPDDSALAGPIADMLATNLARVPGLRVLSNARMLEVAHQLQPAHTPGADDSRRRMLQAAQLAGAGEVIEGELYREAPDTLRLDLRRVDVGSGEVREAATVRAPSAFRLVDAATAQIGAGAPPGPDTLRISDVTTSSLAAYRFFEEGLRAIYEESDVPAARRLFTAATREDSTFAMAWYYLAVLTGGGPGAWPLFERADRFADHASDRERLLIRTSWALERDAPSVVALAETLTVRFPDEPDALLLAAAVRDWDGRFMDAVEYGRRVLAMDAALGRAVVARRAGATAPVARCRACDALQSISNSYWLADSMPAMIRTADAFVRLQPRSPGAWNMLAWTYEYAGDYSQALAAYRHQEALEGVGTEEFPAFYLTWAIGSGDFAGADGLLRAMIGSGVSTLVHSALWEYTISLRQQGRLAEALRVARRERAMETREDPSRKLTYDGSISEAAILFELGRWREAAAHFDTIATASAPSAPSLRYRAARHRVWMLTHAATALAAAGDSVAVRRLADSIVVLGLQSSYGRDRRLYHHVRGLLYELRGQPEQAVREFRQSIYSWSLGYTRTNLELARMLLELGRPREAIPPLQSALHGGLDANNLYVTRTELQEMLARAFDAAGQADSARTYYARVASAWAHADPQFAARQRQAARRAAP